MRLFSGTAVAVLALMLTLAACGGSDDAPSASAPSAGDPAASAADGSSSSDTCKPSTDEIQSKAKAVGFDTTVEVADCVATVRTTLKSLAADGEKAMAICAVAANEAFSQGISQTNVVAADGTVLASDKLGTCQPA